jgi:methyl-accepting chemotaxis protein
MDQVTQQNAALVEEASAAAQSLQEQAGSLSQVVSVFKLDAAGRPAHTTARAAASVAPLARPAPKKSGPQAAAPREPQSVAPSRPVVATSAAGDWTEF